MHLIHHIQQMSSWCLRSSSERYFILFKIVQDTFKQTIVVDAFEKLKSLSLFLFSDRNLLIEKLFLFCLTT